MSPLPAQSEPIAIVGWSCRFPGQSNSPSKLWELLCEPRDVRQQFGPERLNLGRFYNKDGSTHGATDVKGQGYLLTEDSRLFDPAFFGISPLEADGMDPQQRILLEAVYETFEAAGYTLEQMRSSNTSVHVGVMTNDYSDIQMRDMETVPQYTATGTGRSILSNRISYVFDLNGPSITIDTACSSSLVAVHQAIQAMQSGDCKAAIVGGVNLILDPSMYIMESKLHMLSPDSQSRMWSSDANGYARGEGVAAMMLKPLSEAIQDNDDIRGLIRGTGVNSDGHSQGITMPKASAQAELIRSTYRRAGLDPISDRPQYFECHGTGTKAGDPVEARAIFEAFIEQKSDDEEDAEEVTSQAQQDNEQEPMYVGSVKTVIGHLEGCAGLAGLIKAALAIENRTIPPNMLFSELNPEIKDYYGQLQIAAEARPWPAVASEQPLRASVNSFGFGGTNAHAILESYTKDSGSAEGQSQVGNATQVAGHPVGPFVVSGFSSASLLGNLGALLQLVKDDLSLNLDDVAWALQTRRSSHRVKAHFVADDREQLIERLEEFLTASKAISSREDIGICPKPVNSSEEPGILGVFTGQGAQWPSMGRGLLKRSPVFRQALERCDAFLKALFDGPQWSLIAELEADASTSRVGQAEISQPLCTAVQIGLVDMLQAAGVEFSAVVGHSSGEIAAVYSCGIITLEGAIQIAFYRGKWAKLAHGPNASGKGAMMAAGMTLEEAEEFCASPKYQGRLGVAASNGPQSVTLSGDADAIAEAKEELDEKKQFARLLQVDTAYHSHHMQSCASKYLDSLTACNIQVSQPRPGCVWNSSVRGDTELLYGDLSSLKGTYWVQNMVQPVLFQQAVKSSIWHGGPFDLGVEVGPHPALKGPTEQTLKSAFGSAPAYTGVLKRGGNDVQELFSAIGNYWAQLGPSFVEFEGLRKSFASAPPNPSILAKLPSYCWDHDKVYWRESRISRKFRQGQDYAHELLGRRSADDTDREMRWRNVLKASELPWVAGHEILGEVLLPGAAYVSLAFEAAMRIAMASAAKRRITLLEIQDMNIHHPIVVPTTKEGIETIFTTHILGSSDADTLEVSFVYHYCPDERIGSLVNTCDGRLLIHLGDGSEQQPQLPSRAEVQGSTASSDDLLPVNTKSMYELLKETGLNYTGLFKRLQQAKRKLGYAVSGASWEISEFSDSYVAHPAVLDVCFQSLFIARSSPDVSHVYATPLPVHIKRLALDPNVSWASASSNSIDLAIESFITKQDGSYLDGDLHIYDANSGDAILQVETLAVNPVAEPTAEQDSDIFSSVSLYADPSWRLTELDRNSKLDERETVLAYDVERVTLYYVQYVLKAIDVSERPKLAWHHQRMLEAFEQMVEEARSGQHAYASPEWLDDDREILDTLIAKHPDVIDMIACQRVGENMLAVVRGEIQILELMMENNILERVYMEACGWVIIIEALVSTLKQLAHKFPRANILEIGAGTGGTTWTLFQTISDAIGTYTYTDISTGFFEAAANKFADYKDKMIFKALDVSADPEPQGYEKGTYDIIVATNVLHATPELNTTLANTRSLLKPGGYLVLVETSGISIMRSRFVMAGMPGWYLGADDGRRLHPGLSTEGWNERLTEVGFSGVDSVFYDSPDYEKHLVSLMVTQAVNDTVVQLRNPLSVNISPKKQSTCLLIGGKTLTASKVLQSIKDVLRSIGYKNIKKAATVEAVNLSSLSRGVDVICLQELDKPLFSSDISASALSALQRLFLQTKNIIWVTQNRLAGNPRCNMMLGIMRALKQELPQMNAQMVDLERIANAPSAARTIMETFMRLRIISEHEHDEEPLLWLQESELIASADHMLIPRVIPDQGINERHNAKYRYVNNTASSADTAAQVVSQRGKLVLVEPEVTGYTDDKTTVQVNVEYSLQAPLLSMARVYICVGHNADTQQAVIALSEVNGSMIRVLEQKLISISSADVSISTIEAVAAHIIAREASCDVQHHEAALFYNIPAGTRSNIIQEEFQRQEKQVFFASSSSSTPTDWIRLPANSSVRAMRALIPRQVALFVNCSDIPIRNSTSLYNSLSVGCKTTEDVVFQQHLAAAYHDLSLKDVYDSIKGSLKIFADAAPSYLVVEANDIVGREDSTLSESIITSWKSSVPYVLAQQPADRTALFHPNKTYLMSGMAGGLGLSICGWALRQGAKNLIIASRNPQISPEWLQEAKNLGANVQVVKMNATDKASVQYVVDNVCTIMPPVAGICNAAMVLHDNLFMDMDADSMNRCLRPKVDGSWNLHTAFANVALDFFILLGSGASIVGNPGQSNYHAANEFMVALVGQRRQQGQAASIIHIGAVMDIGYVSRQSAGHKAAFQALQVPLISETDVHYAFAEAIFAGRKDSTRSFEVIVGISRIKKFLEEGERPAWLNDPRCSHLTSTVKVQTQQRSENAASSHNLRGQMESAHTEEEALPTLRDACCAKLESMMQLPEGSVDVDRSMIDIGIDSLVAVEIRTWFLKELGSDIPVLKILGGHSVATICVIAAQQLLAKRLAVSQKTDDSQNDIPHINAVDSDNISSSGNSEHQRIFLTDLNAAYNMRPLKTRGLTCIDYTQHQLKEAKSEYYQTQLKYWRKEFASAPQVMPLLSTAKTRLRPNTQSTKTHYAWREINEKLSAKIKSACQITKTTPFHFHLAVIQAFFSLSLSANEICIGVADSNRITSHYSETVGFFMNMLPVRLPLIRKARFSQMMQSTSRKVFTALENSAVSFDAILNDLKVARSASHTPLFQVAVNYRNGAVRDIPLGNTVMVMRDAQDAKNPYDISFGIVEASQDQSMVEVTFQGSLYDEPACQEILDSYMRLVEAFSSNPSGFVNDNDFYSPEGVSKAVALGQGPQVEFDWPSTLPERFLDMATRWKDQPAIRQGTASFTYGELRGRVASLAAELQKVVCVAGSRIVVLCEPSVDFITSLLAILHIGGIYIPLDVSLPLPRHETMVKTCKPSLVICHEATHAPAKSLAKHLPLGLLNIDDIGHDDSQSTKPVASDPKSAAFILFTSGSTGTPKGVMLSQANFINHIALKSNRLHLKEERENVLQQSSLGFDMSLVQIFCALGNGGTLVIIPHESRWDPSYITNAILRDNVTLTIATPSEYKLWLEYGEILSQANQWRHACLGGEPITGQLVRRFSSLGCDRLTLTNCYGPTEITAAAAFHTVSAVETKGVPGESIVGKALPNYQVYILDNQGRPMPPGFAGEICIGGSGLALGYLDSAVQTNSKFIKSPFREGRVYRTGDMGRLEQDGSLVLMGRLDGNTQIKLGGIRMELTEIEEAVMNVFDGQLVNVVVTVRGDALVAHATAASGREINHTKSQTLLQELPLPQYMRPSQIFLVDQLPMTSNGKVDRKAAAELPLPAETTSSEARGSSKFNLQEGELRLLWDKILVHKQGLSPDSDFFLAGGNSIQLIKLQHAIRESMGVLVPTHKLYRACTLRDMSAVIQSQKGSQEHDEEINWEEETSWKQTQLHELSQLVSHREAKTGDNSGAHILLTGANSFLGTAILDTLVKNEAVAGVYCIAILPDEVDKVPSSNDKVVTYAGSLSLPTLGLDNAQRADLQNTVDVVIHAGANGHCLNNYSSVRAGNVQSTRFLASLAVAAQVPLLFVSSNRVTLLSGNNSLPPVSVAAHHPPTTGEEGFTASKWASEQLLEKLVHSGHSGQDFGLDVQIHRPCIVIGDDAPSSDALNNILRFSRAISTIPYYENMGGYLDLKPVEQVAGDIASAAMEMISSYAGVTSSVRYRHHSGGEKVSIDGMQKHMKRMYNCTLERLDIREWIPKATEAGLDEMISVYLLSLLETGTTLQFPYLGEQ